MDDLRDRVAAIERALSDGESDPNALTGCAANLEREVESFREEVDVLAASTQAPRGYGGGPGRSVVRMPSAGLDRRVTQSERRPTPQGQSGQPPIITTSRPAEIGNMSAEAISGVP